MIRVGLSACFFPADPQRAVFKGKTLLYAEESMIELVSRAGALTYLLPRTVDGGPSVEDYVGDLDGLVLQGGSDVCPRTYGEEPLRAEWEGDGPRDRYEIELIRAFVAAGKPVLGICRGLQILNVAFGGTLHQDLETQVPGAGRHRDWDLYDANHHQVDLAEGSWLASLYGEPGRVTVNSVHHQGIKELAPGFAVEARSVADGVIEAIRRPDATYIAAVQWHPEFTPADRGELVDPVPLVAEFVDAARAGAA